MYHTIFHGYCIVCFVDCQSYSELVEVLKFVIKSVTEKKCPPLMVGDLILTISSQSLPRQGGSLVLHREVTAVVKNSLDIDQLCVFWICIVTRGVSATCFINSLMGAIARKSRIFHSYYNPIFFVVFASIRQCFTVVLKIYFHVIWCILTCCFLITGFIQ